MNRILPSKRIRSQIEALISGGFEDQDDLPSHLIRLGVQQLTQEALERKASDYLGREHNEHRREGQEHRGYRNGYRSAPPRARGMILRKRASLVD